MAERPTDPREQGTGEELRRWEVKRRQGVSSSLTHPQEQAVVGPDTDWVAVVEEAALEAAHRRGREEAIGQVEPDYTFVIEELRQMAWRLFDGDPVAAQVSRLADEMEHRLRAARFPAEREEGR